eukprot:scaffold52537_cov58-Phaeocystis_antarctica.AAC.4
MCPCRKLRIIGSKAAHFKIYYPRPQAATSCLLPVSNTDARTRPRVRPFERSRLLGGRDGTSVCTRFDYACTQCTPRLDSRLCDARAGAASTHTSRTRESHSALTLP